MIKQVITAHQKQTADFSLIFCTSIASFSRPSGSIFSSYLMLRILVNFLGHQLQHELPQTQSLLVYLSRYEQFQHGKTHHQVFMNSIHNLRNPDRLNRIFRYVLVSSLHVISEYLQVFCHLSSHFNLL